MKTCRTIDKIFLWNKKLSLSYIVKLFLNFGRFELQYSYLLYSYKIKSVYTHSLIHNDKIYKNIEAQICYTVSCRHNLLIQSVIPANIN